MTSSKTTFARLANMRIAIPLAVATSLVFMSTPVSLDAQPRSRADWLHDSQQSTPVRDPICNNVPRTRVVGRDLIAVSAFLHVDLSRVKFDACDIGGFSTYVDPDGGTAYIQFSEDSLDETGCLPVVAIAHELGHIVQWRQFGSRDTLIATLGIKNTELGADFLAGYALRHVNAVYNPTSFASSDYVRGNFKGIVDDHGQPVQRTNAFRRGWFYLESKTDTPETVHLQFQADLIRNIGGEFGDKAGEK